MVHATLLTSGDIARALDRDCDSVRHILNSRRDIQPIARAGIVRLYPEEVVGRVAAELAMIEARRGGGPDSRNDSPPTKSAPSSRSSA